MGGLNRLSKLVLGLTKETRTQGSAGGGLPLAAIRLNREQGIVKR